MLIDARARERQIKGWRREKKENLIQYGKPLPNQPLTNTVTP
jgi:predicted GIY-YIG superfamily endonuclease